MPNMQLARSKTDNVTKSHHGVIIALIAVLLIINPSLHHVHANENGRRIELFNRSGAIADVYWIPSTTKQPPSIIISNLNDQTNTHMHSTVSHQFEIREHCQSNEGEKDACRVSRFTVGRSKKQEFHINANFTLEYVDENTIEEEENPPKRNRVVERKKIVTKYATSKKSIDSEVQSPPIIDPTAPLYNASSDLEECEKLALDSLKVVGNTENVIKAMSKCVENSITDQIVKGDDDIQPLVVTRNQLADHFENYTCADYDLPSTKELYTEIWSNDDNANVERQKEGDEQEPILRTVRVLLERPASKIHLIENFISPEECQAVEDVANSKLHSATVADGKGGSQLSPNRKAKQAGLKIMWNKESQGNSLTKVSRRVYNYVNHVLGLDIEEHGQEDLMSIQYKGRGEKDETPDRYMPHCDGDCTGMDHRQGQRMTTVVIYCTVPTKGGATNFRKSGIHVQPQAGSATFFSYMDPNTHKMDSGFTEHSGCPVIEGEKKIVTQWVRYGVDSENRWNSFNTLGIKLKDAESQ